MRRQLPSSRSIAWGASIALVAQHLRRAEPVIDPLPTPFQYDYASENPGTLSAYGILYSDITHDLARSRLLTATLDASDDVRAAWLGGSDASGRTDAWSD